MSDKSETPSTVNVPMPFYFSDTNAASSDEVPVQTEQGAHWVSNLGKAMIESVTFEVEEIGMKVMWKKNESTGQMEKIDQSNEVLLTMWERGLIGPKR